jgi:AraC-like DNA-binding protein
MSAAMGAAVNRVMQNPRETEFHRLAFEGDVLDLLVLHLQELHGIGKHNSPAPQCSDETRLARAARDMLMASLAAPPDLKLMASLLGTSAITLKKAFTKVFGASPHKYAGARRMEYAKHLLEKGHMNVNEVSSELGYANTSRFIDAFQRTYGAKPGAYMRGIRRSYMLMAPAQMRAEPSPKRERL